MILGIDTSLGTGVALIEPDGVVRGLATSPDPRGHAEVIGDLLVDALGADGDAVTHVAVGMGPGPFTGLRVGIAAARAFALGRGIPVLPVVSHDAVALERLLADTIAGRDTPPFAVVTDARRREIAVSTYGGLDDDGLPLRTAGPTLSPAWGEPAHNMERIDAASVPPVFVALAAARGLAVGRVLASDQPIYLRAPDVTVPRAPKRVSG